MARSSGANVGIKTLANTWTQNNTFSANVITNGGTIMQSFLAAIVSIFTAAQTIVSNTLVSLCDTTAGAFTLTLPATPTGGELHFIKQIGSVNALTIAGNGRNIDGAASLVFTAQNEAVVLSYSSVNNQWYVVAQVATVIL